MDDQSVKTVESAKLNFETGLIGWEELARHFARGVVICLASDVDLVDAGQALLRDDAKLVGDWQQQGKLCRASDEDGRRWHAESTEFWALVIAPWVLVQEVGAQNSTP